MSCVCRPCHIPETPWLCPCSVVRIIIGKIYEMNCTHLVMTVGKRTAESRFFGLTTTFFFTSRRDDAFCVGASVCVCVRVKQGMPRVAVLGTRTHTRDTNPTHRLLSLEPSSRREHTIYTHTHYSFRVDCVVRRCHESSDR
jgi:hypothetical protein